jgi:Fungal chitosanase of glycosyl hydrolase group 75/Carbohydrate binding module (family 6)
MHIPRRSVVLLTGAMVASLLLLPASPAHAAATRYEAESATISQGVVESNHPGFSGTGFVNYDNLVGSFVQWTINAPAAGTATLALRFANGTTTNRPMDLTLNGTLIADELSFPGTGSWDTWQTKTVTHAVVAGANTLRATATTVNGGPNADFLDVDVSTVVDYQAEDATVSQGLVESNHTGFTGTGFVNYDNLAGSFVQWTVNAAAAGTVNFQIRFANGTTTNRPMDLTVNGVLVADELSFPSTGTWDAWSDRGFSATLNAGANTVRATATTANGGPNVDRLRAGVTDAPPTAAELLAKVSSCSQISTGLYRTDQDTSANIPVCGKNGAVFWKADMDIDCDGIRTTQCNENTDCCFLPDTFCHTASDQPLNAAVLPYVVVPSPSSVWDYRSFQIGCGSVVAIIFNNQVLYAPVGDTGPTAIIGEASYAAASRLGIDPDPSTGGTDSGVTYIVFRGSSRISPIDSQSAAASLGEQLARTFVNNN